MKIILLAVLSLIVATSCSKRPQLKEEDDGVAASAVEVQNTLAKAWGDVDPLIIRKNEFAYLEGTQRIQDLDPEVYLQEGLTITNRCKAADDSEYTYTMAHQTREVGRQGESKSSTIEEHISVPNTGNLSMKAMSIAQKTLGDGQIKTMNLGVQTVYSLLMACVKSEDRDVSCHNLKYSEELMPAPLLVQNQPHCGGLADCKIHVRRVAFDYIFNEKNPETNTTERTKIQFSLAISPDAPYLSRLMEYCYRGLYLIPSAGQKVLLEVCSKVKNFEKGIVNPEEAQPPVASPVCAP